MTAPEPKYWYLRTVLVRAIDSEFTPGQVLPNERDLAARFGVARATLRQALDQLELEGRLIRRRGIGTLVAAPRVGVPVASSVPAGPSGPGESGGGEEAAEGDSWRFVGSGPASAPAAVASELGVAAGASVHTVRRLRVVGGRTVGTETLYVPSAQDGGLHAADPAAPGPQDGRAPLGLAGESRAVELGVAEDAEARLLERPPGSPVLVVTTRYASEGRTAAVAVSTYRADTCRLTFGPDGGGRVEVGAGADRPVRNAS